MIIKTTTITQIPEDRLEDWVKKMQQSSPWINFYTLRYDHYQEIEKPMNILSDLKTMVWLKIEIKP